MRAQQRHRRPDDLSDGRVHCAEVERAPHPRKCPADAAAAARAASRSTNQMRSWGAESGNTSASRGDGRRGPAVQTLAPHPSMRRASASTVGVSRNGAQRKRDTRACATRGSSPAASRPELKEVVGQRQRGRFSTSAKIAATASSVEVRGMTNRVRLPVGDGNAANVRVCQLGSAECGQANEGRRHHVTGSCAGYVSRRWLASGSAARHDVRRGAPLHRSWGTTAACATARGSAAPPQFLQA